MDPVLDAGDTDIGGASRRFRTTIWSDVLAAGDPTHPDSRRGVENLIRAYWKPVYACLRAGWKASREDAKDYTQAFFARLIEKETWSRIQQERGSFRSYLRTALKHFMINAREAESVRRPANALFSLDATPEEFDRLSPPDDGTGPEEVYEREWVRCVVDAAVADLKSALDAEGRAAHFEVFRMACLEGGEAPSYEEVATRLGLSHSDVRHGLARCRSELRRLVRDRARGYVATEEEADRELKEAFGL